MKGLGPKDLVVVASSKPWGCASCGEQFSRHSFLTMDDAGPLCMDCADLGHLEFLSRGDAALTRRAKAASLLAAVVVQWSSARKRYERQGILAEVVAIEQAEQECLADTEVRERRRLREAGRRVVEDEQFTGELAAAIRSQFPGARPDRADRSPATPAPAAADASAAPAPAEGWIRTRCAWPSPPPSGTKTLAYEELLMNGVPRMEARERVRGDVDRVVVGWVSKLAEPGRQRGSPHLRTDP